MTDTRFWEIDRLAATKLLARLGSEAPAVLAEEVAAAFAEHRCNVQQWTANRVQSRIIEALEAKSMQDFGQKGAHWADGFIAAEQLVAGMSTSELLDQPAGSGQSKGQVLRAMVRGARKGPAIVEKRSR